MSPPVSWITERRDATPYGEPVRKTLLLVLGLAARTASAEEAAPLAASGSPDPATSPGFVLIDRFDADGRLGFDFAYVPTGSSAYGRVDFHAHYIEPTSHIGGYAQIQHWNVLGDQTDVMSEDSGTGAPELGALYVSRLRENASLIYRIGMALPTDSMSYEPEAQASRPTDLYQHLQGATVVRLGVSTLVRSGTTYVRGDAGLDAAVSTSSRAYSDVPFGIRLNAGIGTDLGSVALMAEVSTLTAFKRDVVGADGPLETRLRYGIFPVPAVTIRVRAAHFQPYASLSAPLLIGDLSWSVTVGADISFDEH